MTTLAATPAPVKPNRAALKMEGRRLKEALKAAEMAVLAADTLLAETAPADPTDEMTGPEVDTWALQYEIAAEAAGTYKARELRLAAEQAVIDWAEKVMRLYFPEKFGAIAICFEKRRITNLILRRKLVDICLKIEG